MDWDKWRLDVKKKEGGEIIWIEYLVIHTEMWVCTWMQSSIDDVCVKYMYFFVVLKCARFRVVCTLLDTQFQPDLLVMQY